MSFSPSEPSGGGKISPQAEGLLYVLVFCFFVFFGAMGFLVYGVWGFTSGFFGVL